jgi:type IV secretory pathway VirB2 component (pilin)
MLHDMFSGGMGWMMTGMGLLRILVVVVLVLGAAALVKNLMSGRGNSR